MKRTYNILYLFLILTLYGCKSAEEKRIEKVDKICNRVTFSTASQLVNSHEGLQFLGFGGGGVFGINNLSITFNYYKDMNVENGRKLMVECMESFLKNINEDEDLRPHLKIFPFRSSNVEIEIFSPPNNVPIFPCLNSIICWRGKIRYYYLNERESEEEHYIEESYETALTIVKKGAKHESKK